MVFGVLSLVVKKGEEVDSIGSRSKQSVINLESDRVDRCAPSRLAIV